MEWRSRSGLRRHLSLMVSFGLVLLIGGLGLVAGHTAGQQARDVHRADRLQLQLRLAGLVEQFAQVSAAEVLDKLAVNSAWSTTPGDPQTVARLEELVTGTRALDVGAVLVSPVGRPLASWSVGGPLPARDDQGWAPLRAAVRKPTAGAVPLSDVMPAGDRHVLAMGLPVQLRGGARGLLLGLWDPRRSPLQTYVSELSYGKTGHGYVLDDAGNVIAGPTDDAIGKPLPLTQLREVIARSDEGIAVTDDGKELVTSYATAGATSWTALTPQSRAEFEGDLAASSRRVQAAVVALLLIAGTGLVVLHRKREAALEAVALRDELTGLYNRRGWFVLAEHELERARRQSSARVLLFIDLDGLKQVNDALGHREGDRAIADAAAVLTAASRSSDLVGRLGGDEFVLLLGEDGRADVARRRLVEALDRHNADSGAGFELRLSIGAEVWFPDAACTLDELVRRADAEMYAEKSSRPGRHEGLLRVPAPRVGDAQVPVR
jgi:diguanylate cyclase (GGDEF)-like protein